MFALVLVLGLAAGYLMGRVCFVLIRNRTDNSLAPRLSNGPLHMAMWMSANCVIWLAVWRICGISLHSVEIAIIASIALMLSVIDVLIKKIPNELLAALFIVHLVVLLLGKKPAQLPASVLGAAVGLALFLLPALFKKGGVGLGDVKLASAVGFILTTADFFVSTVLMAVFLLAYAACLIITGKGGLKSKVALGPFIAVSLVIIMTFKALTSQGPLEYFARTLAG